MKNKKLFAILTLVCFMMTLMPVAAFAAQQGTTEDVADSLSVVWTEDTTVRPQQDAATFNLKLTVTDPQATTATVYVWVTAEGSNVPVNTVNVNGDGYGAYVYSIAITDVTAANTFPVLFYAPGVYQVHASAVAPSITNGVIASATEFKSAGSVVTAVGSNDDTTKYIITTNVNGTVYEADGVTQTNNAYLEDGDVEKTLQIVANNVDEKQLTITLEKPVYDAQGNFVKYTAVAGVAVDVEAVGAISTDKTTVYTNALGQAKFKVGGSRDGEYKLYLSTGKYESSIEVKVGAIVANSIVSECETGKYDILGAANLADVISFTMYDVNGNKLAPANNKAVDQGWDKAANSTSKTYGNPAIDATGYVAIVEKPADSKIKNENLKLEMVDTDNDNKDDTLTIVLNSAKIDAEGVYTFKVVLNNGAYATATCDVKEFDKPATLIINGADNVELGAVTTYRPIWIDAYGVKDTAPKGVEIAATGYAVETFVTGNQLTVKSDEKYVGSVITLTAIDERYNLVATKEVTVAAEAKELKFAANTAEVSVNNFIKINVVDANGKVVALDGGVASISYVVLEKPEGANVFVSDYSDGYSVKNKNFVMNLTSNKVGNVKVQAIVKYVETVGMNEVANVVKYYTGTQTIAVGTGEIGKSVVMSIGSNELIVGSEVTKMDAKPMVQNSRTFVPFRALAEAFGATVAYDQATSSVTAELNGVKVVMTVGAPVYTVNGVEKTADVAPFISDSRTFVPVRFAAEAFGIEVVPTYNEDGSVADVLFNM